MAMKHTSALELVFTHHQARDVIIMHPNAGFEIDMMTKSHPVSWSTGLEARDFLLGKEGSVHTLRVDLINECPHGQIRLHASHAGLFGTWKKAVVFYDGQRLFIHGT